jgi:hypothetical protein
VPKNTQLSVIVTNAQADALARMLDNGWIDIYDGMQPVNADMPISSQTLLVSLRFQGISAPAARNGVLVFNDIATAIASGSGNAAFYRCTKTDHTTVVMDGSIDLSGANMNLNSIGVTAGANVTLNSFSHTVEAATSGL